MNIFHLIIIKSNNSSFLCKTRSRAQGTPINVQNEGKIEHISDGSIEKEVIATNCINQTSLQCQSPRDFSKYSVFINKQIFRFMSLKLSLYCDKITML